ncbi:DUF2383 domain-containing protein [Bacillus testis]|uniref:DUF2383 domain-containing protein n=1 Tax=Bacillus testis TaxID=1622072 RepID=UPI00067F045C|nr:DUF2383 domain-containing protein [Bacillus testis]
MENQDVKELNDLLRGLYMGVYAYEHYIHNCGDPSVKKTLQKIQQEHKFNTIRVAERIQNLGGVPIHDEGITRAITDFFSKMTSPTLTEDILEDALRSEEKYRAQMAANQSNGQLSEKNIQLIDDIVERNACHVATLRETLDSL